MWLFIYWKKIVVFVFFVILSAGFTNKYFEISKHLDVFSSLFKELNIYYVDETSPGELIESAIDEMLGTLDPYTVYMPESEIEDFKIQTTGQYGGIGSLIRKRGDYVIISEPYEGFPAYKSGLKAGDKLLEIDGKSAKGKTTEEVSNILKGQPDTQVGVLIKRYGVEKPISIVLKREKIQLECVPYYGFLDGGIGYVRLTSFTDKATRSVRLALEDLKSQQKLNGVVLDLRGNPGGLLREAINVCNLFVEKGQEIVRTKGKVKEWDKSYQTLNSPLDTTVPLAVLISRGSASASEIVSGTMQDLDRGVVIGQKSFGKGLVQQTRKLPYNSQLKVTIAKYYTPSGRCIQALDYSNRNEDGSVGSVPDSLKTEFKTVNGRSVFDGGGISPDFIVEQKKYSTITKTLIAKSLIFDFATDFAFKNQSIESAESFVISSVIYDDFLSFLENKEFEFESLTDVVLQELIEQAEKENYYTSLETTILALKKDLKNSKKNSAILFKEEIKSFLREEIVSRYYHQEGRIVSSLIGDNEVKEAVRLLKNTNEYYSVLNIN